ncbi:predicted protein [Naegleria gruberi]|uniref:Predicted protein n=1 Tax=Naegleria gruberi TaxID=5762 RepID=D2VYS3_NAEGR|nr:uncharacterized protein NAEGRDRAFT_74222 [Naegleria gruberi]EFC37961.1 predicted protein [Naegleria gruberi]|eukprot:XP_002670705.1 predicted protein [Naegleria gruberi strain NEG-M]
MNCNSNNNNGTTVEKVERNFHLKEGGGVLGIDLGTTNSCVAIMEGNHLDAVHVRVLENELGFRTTPSVVAFDSQDKLIVGEPAKRQAIMNPKNTLHAVKRLIGLSYEDARKNGHSLPFELVSGKRGQVAIRMGNGKEFSPTQISAFILQHMRDVAQQYLGQRIDRAVITVPAYFNENQKQATMDAGMIAGITVERIINEPTAAALAYGLGGKRFSNFEINDRDGTIVVFDLGGGTFDVSILEISGDVFQVVATNGDAFLGGEDFDNRILQWIVKKFKEEQKVNLEEDPLAYQRLKEAAEKAKIELSSVISTEINLPFIGRNAFGPVNLKMTLKRSEFETMCADLVERTLKPVQKCMKDAGLRPSDISQVILVGGMTRMPLIEKMVSSYFQQTPNKSVNPDEAVAIGAAIQGSICSGQLVETKQSIILLDVVPLSLGVALVNDVYKVMIPRNTQVPARFADHFTTIKDNQTNILIDIYQGERELASKNKNLGQMVLSGIPPAPKGIPNIKTTFSIDVNGLLFVESEDMASGSQVNMFITSHNSLTNQEIEEMRKLAEQYKYQDTQQVEWNVKKTESEELIQKCENSQHVAKDSSNEKQAELGEAIRELRHSVSNRDSAKYTSITDLLKRMSF